jgi:diaminopimelate epimerase
VEGETLACGTGVLAAVATGIELGALSMPVAALTLGGFTLRVGASDQLSGRWSLQGDARILSRGELLAGAEQVPQPTRWS